ncbi:MAG: hypothetical protein QOH62_1626 [Solirubrobacteraceae bacterium]|nr:hypothetical protein [Solirubrobacteraceae bacterium]
MSKAATLLLTSVALAGCGGGGGSHAPAPLAWDGAPKAFKTPGLPHDGVVLGKVRNTTKRTLHLKASTLLVRDTSGRRLRSSAAFTTTYAHGLFGALQQPGHLPRLELQRLGKIVDLPPGESAPFYAAWHLGAGSRAPVKVDYGSGTLAVPSPSGG